MRVVRRNLGSGRGRIEVTGSGGILGPLLSPAGAPGSEQTAEWKQPKDRTSEEIYHYHHADAGSRFVRWGEPCQGLTTPACVVSAPHGEDFSWTIEAEFAREGERIEWTGGAGTSDWFTAGNWDLNRVPTATDEVVIARPGAVVDLGDPAIGSADFMEEIFSLRHSSGTLRIRGPGTCANCGRLTVAEGITSSGVGTRLVLQRADLVYRSNSSLVTLETGEPGNGGTINAQATLMRPSLTIENLIGHVAFSFSEVSITRQGDVVHGIGLQQSQLTIAPGATVVVAPSVGTGDGSIGGDSESALVVGGTLRVPQSNFNFGHTTVSQTGVLEIQFARFNGRLINRGTIRGITVGQVIPAFPLTLGSEVTLEAGSQLIASQVEFRSPAIVRGRIEASSVQAASDAAWSFEMPDVSQSSINNLSLGAGPVRLGLSGNASLGTMTAVVGGLSAVAPIEVSSAGTAELSITDLRLSNRGLVGGASTGRLAAGRVEFGGSAGVLLDNIVLAITGPATSLIQGSGTLGGGMTGRNGTRVIQAGAVRLRSAYVGPPAGNAVRQFYFEHRGELRPESGESVVSGCIETAGGTIGTGAGTVTMAPLAPGDC